MTRPLTHQDIRDFLTAFAAVIELDQIRVDSLPRENFHPAYSDGMWRLWWRCHLEYIDQVLPTVNAIPSPLLQELTQLAITYEPSLVRATVIDLFTDAAGGLCDPKQFETAALLLGWLIKDVSSKPAGKSMDGDARALMMQWLALTDPLRISELPECRYGRPAGFVH